MESQLTPTVRFDRESGDIYIAGKSIDMNSQDFWIPLTDEVIKYLSELRDLTIIFELDFFNTRSAKYIYEFLKGIKNKLINTEHELNIKWISDNNDLYESGLDYCDLLGYGNWEFIKK
jgi:hypothetical protein